MFCNCQMEVTSTEKGTVLYCWYVEKYAKVSREWLLSLELCLLQTQYFITLQVLSA
jgi:hypothetical protein